MSLYTVAPRKDKTGNVDKRIGIEGVAADDQVLAPKSITDLLSRAKVSIIAGEHHLREAAEYIAAAVDQGATQFAIAQAVGKSQPWVSALLKWRLAGFPDTAFGPQSKAAREARTKYQSTNNHTERDDPDAIAIGDLWRKGKAAFEAAE